ncbi:Fic family protein [Nocardia sp. NPDC051900]|uniref:Fic family protein n=1 Tax=Nocardia sp. NPDC051900 TaxID=3364326 RepID=UPI003797ABAE
MPQGTVPLGPDYSAVEYRTPPKAIEGELQALSDWYNVDRKLPGTDPYQLAAELQRRYISIHPYRDYNGSSSRILMNWSLENHELPPSALSDFDKDIFSTTGEWTDMVRERFDGGVVEAVAHGSERGYQIVSAEIFSERPGCELSAVVGM